MVLPGATPFRIISVPILPNISVPEDAVTFRTALTFPTTGCPGASESVPPVPRITVLAPVIKVPFTTVRTPLIVTSPLSEIPFTLFRVRLFNVIPGSEVPEPEPPTAMFEATPPIRDPVTIESVPFRLSVCAPIMKLPLASVSVPLTVSSESIVIPAGLAINKLFNVDPLKV